MRRDHTNINRKTKWWHYTIQFKIKNNSVEIRNANLHANNNNNPKIMWNVIFLWKFSCRMDGGKFLLRKPENKSHTHTHARYELLGWCYANLFGKNMMGHSFPPFHRLRNKVYDVRRVADERLEMKIYSLLHIIRRGMVGLKLKRLGSEAAFGFKKCNGT